MSLATVKVLRLLEVREVFVVGEDLYWVGRAIWIVSPFLQCMDYSQQFPIIDVIVPLSRGQGVGEESTWFSVTIGVFLHEHSTSSILGGISGNSKQWHLDQTFSALVACKRFS